VIGRIVVVVLLAFMTLPTVVVVVASVNPTEMMAFPPSGFSLRWYEHALTYPQFRRAAVNSVLVTAASAAVALPIGTAAALALVRHPLRARGLWTALLLSPLVVPGVAAGLGLLIVAARLGLLASHAVLIAAHVILVLPFVIRSVMVSVANLDPLLERAAASLGASPWRTFRRVTLPLLRPGLVTALLFAVIVSVNEFVVSLFVSTRVTEILPVAMFTYVVNYTDPTMAALSTLFITATFVVVFAADRLLNLSRMFQIEGHGSAPARASNARS
jgi:putative spermidine/putrescine transport system permease protein